MCDHLTQNDIASAFQHTRITPCFATSHRSTEAPMAVFSRRGMVVRCPRSAIHQAPAVSGKVRAWRLLRRTYPLLGRSAGYYLHIGAGFPWKRPASRQPVSDAPRTSIVSGSSQAHISELPAEFSKPACCFFQSLNRLEWIRQSTPSAGPGINWAIPWALARLTDLGSKLLSCRIRRAKNSLGRPYADAMPTRSLQSVAIEELARAGASLEWTAG